MKKKMGFDTAAYCHDNQAAPKTDNTVYISNINLENLYLTLEWTLHVLDLLIEIQNDNTVVLKEPTISFTDIGYIPAYKQAWNIIYKNRDHYTSRIKTPVSISNLLAKEAALCTMLTDLMVTEDQSQLSDFGKDFVALCEKHNVNKSFVQQFFTPYNLFLI